MADEDLDWGDLGLEVAAGEAMSPLAAERTSATEKPSERLVSARDASVLPSSPKAVLAAAEALGWVHTAREWVVAHPDEFYAGDSKATGASAGDLKKPAYESRHLGILARKEGSRLGFYAEWTLGETAKGAPSAKWGYAIVADPVGLPRPLEADYTLDADYVKTLALSATEAKALADRRAYQYNDGADYLARTLVLKRAADLTLWLEDWQSMLVSGYERPAPKPERKGRPKQADLGTKELLAAGEWVG